MAKNDAYSLYKPLRNHLHRTSLMHGLGVVRAYLQHFQFNQAFPHDIEVPLKVRHARSSAEAGVFEWELEILAKEIILNSPEQAKTDLRRWDEFAGAVNKLRKLEEDIHKRYGALFKPNILMEIARIAHRQFHWQAPPGDPALVRYYKIFGEPQMNALLERELGLSAKKLYTIGLALAGQYLQSFGVQAPIPSHLPGISDEDVDTFVRHFSAELEEMRQAIQSAQAYDQDYAYTFNPLKARPLVWVQLNGKRTLIAPLPTYLFRRFTEGVYYELANKPGFSDAFGPAFQQYVGEVARAANYTSRLTILPEEPYHVGLNAKATIDWIVSDTSGHLFVECKTKRLTAQAKGALEMTEHFEEEIGKMAGFIAQAYKTLADAQAGHYPRWKSDGKPIYPVIVTLEDWYFFGAGVMPILEERIRLDLIAADVDPSIRNTHPYSICSARQFETSIQILEKVGIGNGMIERFAGERGSWLTSLALQDAFPEVLKSCKRDLFPKETSEIGVT